MFALRESRRPIRGRVGVWARVFVSSIYCEARSFIWNLAKHISNLLLEKQLKLLGRAAAAPHSSLLHQAVFEPGTVTPRQPGGRRAVGRPRTTWAEYMHKEVNKMNGGMCELASLTNGGTRLSGWYEAVKRHCSE